MFDTKDNNLKKIFESDDPAVITMLATIDKEAGWKLEKFPQDIQLDAFLEAVVAYLEGQDILRHLVLWRRGERRYQKKILAFTRARPLKNDKEEMKDISKKYR